MAVLLLMDIKLPTRALTTAVLGLSVLSFSVLGSHASPAFAGNAKNDVSASAQTKQGREEIWKLIEDTMADTAMDAPAEEKIEE